MAYEKRNHAANRTVTPRLEGLELRCLLSGKPTTTVTIKELPGLNPGTSALEIIDPIKNDAISINDNGSGDAGNIFVSFGSGQTYMSTQGVSDIGVFTGKGTDHVTYELDGNLQPDVSQLVQVGSKFKSGGGSLVFTVNIVGKVLGDASLSALASAMGTKTTTMTVNDSGEVDGFLTAGIATQGTKRKSSSPEELSFQSTATIGAGGAIDAGLLGSSKNDIGSVSYSGTNNGEFDIYEVGNGGNDQLNADVYMMPGSTGTVGSHANIATVKTSGRQDRLHFTIHQGTDSTTTSNIYAALIDSSKKDISIHTANVAATTRGSDIIVS
jgi:hypothetical protein